MEVSLASRVLGTVFAMVALGGLLWFSQRGGETPLQKTPQADQPEIKTAPENEPLPIAAAGPYPKVSVDEPIFDFGVMAVGSEQSHAFVIKNIGEAPLLLKKGKTSCKCTLSTVANEPIPPGGEAEITLEWKGASVTPEFEQAANIWTNDPENKTLELRIRGSVFQPVIVQPAETWAAGSIADDEAKEISGRVVSHTLDSFEISHVENLEPTDWLTVRYEPLTDEEIGKLNQVKCGYKVTARIEPLMPVGPISSRFRVHVKIPEEKATDVTVIGSRPGPFEFHPVGGISYEAEKMGIGLGSFDAKTGKKALLLMFVSGLGDEELQVLETITNPSYLKVTIEPKTENKPDARKKLYNLHVEVPPGLPPEVRARGNIAEATLKINHPKVPELKFKFAWTSR